MSFGVAAAFSALLWWFATGTIFLLVRRPQTTHRALVLCATFIAVAAGIVIRLIASTATVTGAYIGFGCALAVWVWLEITFLTGWLVGPQKSVCPPRLAGWRRFRAAARTVIHNELATLACAIGIAALSWGAANQVALATYLILWGMRLSAKLNLFLGVPNLGERFLPRHLAYLQSYFRRRSMNALFPVSIAVSAALCTVAVRRYAAAADGFHAAADALAASLLALGLLEHLFMVLPIASERLWRYFGVSSSAVGGGEASSDVEGCPTSSG